MLITAKNRIFYYKMKDIPSQDWDAWMDIVLGNINYLAKSVKRIEKKLHLRELDLRKKDNAL